jgi:C-terminal processing protease CtpA/Prc
MRLFILLLLFPFTSNAQNITTKQAKQLSKEIIKVIKTYSIYKDSLDFDSVEKDFLNNIDTFTTYEKVGYYYTEVLRGAGDNHSFYTTQEIMKSYSKKQKENLNFSYKLLDGGIGYLSIPGFLSVDTKVVDSFANSIYNAIREMDSAVTVKGWVVDLRNNTGGNMWPMVSGLNALIGTEATPGYFKFADGKTTSPWKIPSPVHTFILTNQYQLKNKGTKIAVLYGKRTASSGEMTAISFIGKPNTRSFGTATAGYTTANSIYSLREGNIFVLASSYVLDRNYKAYTGKITPDVLIENTGDETLVLKKALAWIKE